ncbi:uncharacterized protein [Littorina saxatilis]|uniref:Uncharacterized protein n=1 Tax=Littorina saxatilis TaxID=31220 RepID=A0AAN9BE86_9CAEN
MASASVTESFICPKCSGIFEDPRVLPGCLHTFCVNCIQGVADCHQGRPFPCPSCRKQTTLSSGGAAALPTNLNIQSEDIVKARQGVFQCEIHPDQQLSMYCEDCQTLLCVKCALLIHKEHNLQDLPQAVTDAEKQLKENTHRIRRASEEIQSRIKATTTEQRTLLGKKKAVENYIKSRHATAIATLNKYLEETLTSLKETCDPLESRLKADLKKEIQNMQEINQLEKKLQGALNNHIDCNLVEVAKDMREGQGSMNVISRLIPEERETCVRPVLRCDILPEEHMARHIQDYFGSVHEMTMTVRKSDETKVERFGIAEDLGTEVFSMCVKDNGSLIVSYAWRNLSNSEVSEQFDSNGSCVSYFEALRGKVSLKSMGKSLMHYAQKEGLFTTFSKSKEHFSLHYNLSSGTGTVKNTTVATKTPFAAEDEAEFTFQCGRHRAFDVDSTGRYFVIVEESQTSESDRNVRLFKRPQEDTPARESQDPNEDGSALLHPLYTPLGQLTYSPPSQPFKPSDVCFYKTDVQEVLLIADEINDAIHVVRVMSYKLEFAGYLCAGHPLLVQPTALTVDSRNRVWVACRGRVVLIVEPDLSRGNSLPDVDICATS